MANSQVVIDTFLQLVKIPSPSGQEEKVIKYIVEKIKTFVSDLYIDKIGNLYVRINGKSKEPLLLCAHMDTVEPAGSQEPIIKKGIIYSNSKYVLGADNKAGIAAILSLIKKLHQEKITHPSLEILFTVREETEGGIRQFPKEKIKAKQGLIMDVSQPIGNVVVGAPYVGGYSMLVRAKGSHVRKMKKDTAHPLNFLSYFMQELPFGRIDKDTIINIAKIRMGESYNSVPKDLYFTGEIRSFKRKLYNSFFKKIENMPIKLDKKIGTKTKVDLYPYCNGYMLKEEDLGLIKNVFKKLNIKYKPTKTFAVGDFSILNEWGIKTTNIGNGAIDVHTTKERIAIDSLLLLEKILFTYVKLGIST